jgi:hypothetical protein
MKNSATYAKCSRSGFIRLPVFLKREELINELTIQDSEDVDLLKFSDFDMGSPGWLKHGLEMLDGQTKNIFNNGGSQATRQNLFRTIPPTGSLLVQNL